MPAPSPRGDLLLQRTLSPRGPSPPEDPLSPDGDSPCLAAQFTLYPRAPSFACRRFTLSRLTAIHLVPQGTLSSRGPSLAAQFTLSRLSAIHLVLLRNSPCTPGHPLLQRTLSRLTAIHLVPQGNPLSPDGDSPCLAPQFTLYPRAPSLA